MSEYMPRGEPPATPNQQELVDSFPYGAIVGSLPYLAGYYVRCGGAHSSPQVPHLCCV
jgi:hypothetical protein